MVVLHEVAVDAEALEDVRPVGLEEEAAVVAVDDGVEKTDPGERGVGALHGP